MSRSVAHLTAWAVDGIPEIVAGDDLGRLIGDAIQSGPVEESPSDGDVIVVTSKIVSKAEGRFVVADDREDAITAETVRVVARREHPGGVTRIVENRLGIVGAAAGVDASNTPDGTVLLLPEDPDATARSLCVTWRERFGVSLGVLITDTLGRAWRQGQTDVAIGAAGVSVIDDLRGSVDASGRRLDVTLAAVGDEIAGLADLIKGKASGRPVAIVRGLERYVGGLGAPGARSLVRTGPTDMFRLGTDEALAEGRAQGLAEGRAQGLAEGHREGFAEGYAKARADAAAETARAAGTLGGR